MRFHKLLIGTVNSHYKKCTSQFGELGLSPGQPKILETLNQINSCNQKELAKACEVEPATITSILPPMEKNGLISREIKVHGVGKRSLSVTLTEKGKLMEKEVSKVLDEAENLCFQGFSEDEKSTFLYLLEKIYKNIK